MTAAAAGSPDGSPPLDYIFHPRSIAIAGLSNNPARWFIKDSFLTPLVRGGYNGNIYLVHPDGGEVDGFPVHRNLKEIPGPVDHVVSCIPAGQTPGLVEECGHKGVKTVQFYTAGYAETGEPDRIDLQDRLLQIARQGGVRLIGPNCMGIYCPMEGVGFCADFPRETGPIGLVCQSGGNADYMIRYAAARGLRFSKAVSYGNACDINECDLLEYLADDPETGVIAAYIEGTRDGRRLARVLARAAAAKPLVVLKGGFTEGGGRATASHTGSLAGSEAVWDGLLRQVGAIRVYSVEEMVDVLVALVRMVPPQGLNACTVGNGGGASVMATDELEAAGLRMPPLPPNVREGIKELIDLAGSMLRNPIDAGPLLSATGGPMLLALDGRPLDEFIWEFATGASDERWVRFNRILGDWTELDMAIFHFAFDIGPTHMNETIALVAGGALLLAARLCSLPKAVVLHSLADDNGWQATEKIRQICVDMGFPLFLSMRGAAGAIRKLVDYNRLYPERLAVLRRS